MSDSSNQRSRISQIVLLTLLVFIIVLLLLLMTQIDRQWSKLALMEASMASQSRDISDLRNGVKALDKQFSSLQKQSIALAKANVHQAQALSNQSHLLVQKATTLSTHSNALPNQLLETIKDNQTGSSITANESPIDTDSALVSHIFRRAYQATQADDYAQGGWRINAFGNTLKTLTPFVSADAYSANVQNYVLESLLMRDPDTLEWKPLLAKSWQVSDNGLTITIQIRDDIVFSDGEPMNSSDVLFTYHFIMNDKINAPRERAFYKEISKIEARGDYEVVFTFDKPYFESLSLVGSMPILPEHIYAKYNQTPELFNQSKGLLFGTGPYRLRGGKQWKPDQNSVELVRNERYWGDVPPTYSRIVWRIIQNDTARLTTFRNGDLDVLDDIQPIDFNKLKEDEQLNTIGQSFNYTAPTSGYGYIGWNQMLNGKATPFRDKRVRQAMTWLLDKQKIVDDIFLGYRDIAVSPFGHSKQHDNTLKARGLDREKGKALLKAAGYEDRDKDGIVEDAMGKPLTIELVYFQNNETTKRLVLLIKDMYARAGVQIIPKPSEWPVMLEMLENKNFQAIVLGWGGTLESDLYQVFHSSQSITNGDNYISYSNPTLDAIIEQARATINEKERMLLWQKAEKILYDDVPYTFLTRKKEMGFYNKRLGNVLNATLGLNIGFVPTETYIPKALQKQTY